MNFVWLYAKKQMTKDKMIDLTESIDNAIFEGAISSPSYATALIKTNIFLRQMLKRYDAICKDCEYKLHPEDYREPLDDGSVMCEECTIKAEADVKADWDTREDALKS
jgi:hypothetical protein